MIYSFGKIPEIGIKKSLDDAKLTMFYHVYRHSDKYKNQVDKASGNWEISRERNEFNGLALPKDELSHREIKRQLRRDLMNHANKR